ncbi:hypothetical protein [Paractinoplanes atraurantiacus]|uniref:Uncharacterized protein n=1 Tax=Paractinoplanes atraurantiacus TaxID=1036182 RepID=A0A285J058_9ACTN|nr:hypothetical protein [Actinoplanes atraurantiacus]SNY53700.1 hypothetical protein SAMN05421748_114142 [Actinoplanes atraurantiacus]
MTGSALAARLRRAAAWRPGQSATRVVTMRCRYCRKMRPARQFRRGALGCRGCVGNG